ncbi:MAG: translation initiation factor IF-2, partial [Bacteroidetes bacterium]|nr:translation initiation factor IF-2 [Bacteroidota bacterium]
MAESNVVRLASVARELNLGVATVAEHLKSKGFEVDNKPTAKLTAEMYETLMKDFSQEKADKEKADQVTLGKSRENIELSKVNLKTEAQKKEEQEVVYIKNIGSQTIETSEPTVADTPEETKEPKEEKQEIIKAEAEQLEGPKVIGKVDLEGMNMKTRPDKKEKKEDDKAKDKEAATKDEKGKKSDVIKAEAAELKGPKVVGKIDLEKTGKPVASSSAGAQEVGKKKRRRKIRVKENENEAPKGQAKPSKDETPEVSEKEIEERIKSTMSRLGTTKTSKSNKAKYKRLKKEKKAEEINETADDVRKTIHVSEFVAVSELGSMLDVPYAEIIQTCMNLGIIVSINQRLDAEIIEVVADEFGFDVKFIEAEEQEEDVVQEEEVDESKLVERPPIVTIMGHVDHGKTSLLDYIRDTNVIAGEAGGITQHIGAYEVSLKNGKQITFLDTPGHEAFTAMRARGAKVTDLAVIVIAADDDVMPQTKEAISHAQAASVPMIFAINKVDKENANPEKIKKTLANMNLLLEDWGGKYQSEEISAKTGNGVEALLEKILLEAEILELKADPEKKATGVIIEASLEKGRGYVTTLLVQEGQMKVGDMILAGPYYGKIKALSNERGKTIKKAEPSTPALVLGLNGAPQAGEKFRIVSSESEARHAANKREQIVREQGLRTKKHITLDEIGRRLALGNFKELNIIVRGDVDGSIEALSDSLLKLSTEEIQLNVIHKAVGQIVESDILLASASEAIIIGFQVRPSLQARKLAEKENIEIRLYSVIYDALEEVRSAMEGMLEPTIEEEIVANLEIRDIYKISRIGTIAGCYVLDGKLDRNTKVRLIRDGIVIYSGELSSLKRFKDDAKEVTAGLECGIGIKNFNDIKVGD